MGRAWSRVTVALAITLIALAVPACSEGRGYAEGYRQGVWDAQRWVDTGLGMYSGPGGPKYAASHLTIRPRTAEEVAKNRMAPWEAIAVLDMRNMQVSEGEPPFALELMPYFLQTPGSAPIVVWKKRSLIELEQRDESVRNIVRGWVSDAYPVRILEDAETQDDLLPKESGAWRFIAPRIKPMPVSQSESRPAEE